MGFFNKDKDKDKAATKEVDAPIEFIQLANKIMDELNKIVVRHEKEIHFAAPKNIDKVNFTQLLTTMILDSHCQTIEYYKLHSRQKQLDNIVKGLQSNWNDKRNGK